MDNFKAEIKNYILGHLKDVLKGGDINQFAVDGDIDLIGSGIISSLGFIELIASIEQKFKIEIDFEKYDPSSYTTISGLASLAVKCSVGETK